MTAAVEPDWIAVDWGSSHMRAWAMSDTGEVIASCATDQGAGLLTPLQFEPALVAALQPWQLAGQTTLVACGMVGAKQGWRDASYVETPCAAATETLVKAPSINPNLNVWIVPGICQRAPADVMRGEETQIAGFLSLNPDWDGVICLPGTHSKWVHISAGEVVSFRSFITGEMFALLSRQSVLRHSIAGQGWDDAAFLDAVGDAMAHPELVASRLFSLRSEFLLNDLPTDTARARLSGLLIGIEIAATRVYWLGQNLAIIGNSKLVAHYQTALKAQGATAQIHPVDPLTIAGLTKARQTLKALTK